MSEIRTNQSGIFWRLLIYYSKITKNFCRNGVLNGLKYLTYEYLTVCEKFFFLGCILAAFCSSVYFAMGIVEKWQMYPVLTVMNPQISFITREPFPAVTICNMNQVQYSKVKDFDVKSLDYAMLQKRCSRKVNYTSYAHLQENLNGDSFLNFVVKNSQSCSDMIVLCIYGNVKRSCTDLFRAIALDEGLCCTFNIVHPLIRHKGNHKLTPGYTSKEGPIFPLDWNQEKGYPSELPSNFYPRPPIGDGILKGFTIILNGDLENFYCSSTNGPGFKVAIHNPLQAPDVKELGLYLDLGLETSFRINSFREDAVEVLRKLTKPQERQCYFGDEYSLSFFNYYTQGNCEMECKAQLLLRRCHCLPYYMPLVSHNASICDVRHFACLALTENDFIDELTVKCKEECFPTCNYISHLVYPFFIPLRNDGFAIRYPFLRNISTETLQNYAVLKLFFPENYYRGVIKTPYIGFTEFLSQVGGVMSLMTGFSVISLVELAFYYIMKPFINCCLKIFR